MNIRKIISYDILIYDQNQIKHQNENQQIFVCYGNDIVLFKNDHHKCNENKGTHFKIVQEILVSTCRIIETEHFGHHSKYDID